MSSSSLRVAHLTDLHGRFTLPGTAALARRRSRLPVLEAVLAEVRRQKVDLLVFTGDLLDVPGFLTNGIPAGFTMPGERAEWLEAVRTDYRAIRTLLEETGIPYRVLPGNHDHGPLLAEVFADQGEEWTFGGYRWVTFDDYEQEGHQPRRLEASRHRFDRVLSDDDATPQIHLQHYLLRTPPTGSYPYAYPEAPWLLQKAAASGRVRLALSGHYHEGTPLERHEGLIYTAGEALCDAPHRWRIYEITPETVRSETFALPPAPSKPVVFLDRDGVINDLPAYTSGPEEMRLIPGSAAAIRKLHQAGIQTVVVTSQSAIGMGYVTRAVVDMVHERMHQLLAAEGAALDAVYFTSGAGGSSVLPGAETWPTKKSGLIEQAFAELPLRRESAWIVGDRLTDIMAGREAGIPGILVRTGFGAQQATLPEAGGVPVCDDLEAAAERILSEAGGNATR